MFTLKRQLKKFKKAAGPRRDFRGELWSKLSNEFDKVHVARLPSKSLAKEGRMSFTFKFAAIGVVALVLLLGTGTGVYAYESPRVAEGHVLFPIKRGIENMEGLFFARGAEGQARFHLKMMQRRLDEAEVHEMYQYRDKMLEQAAMELDMSVQELKSEMLDPETRQEIINELVDENGRFARVFQELMRPEPDFKAVQERIQALKQHLDESDFTDEQKKELFKHFQQMKFNRSLNYIRANALQSGELPTINNK